MKKLKKYLRINSVFSLVTGILMTVFSADLLIFFKIINHRFLFDVIGLNLIAFGMFVGYVSIKQLGNKMLVKLISFLDVIWVFGSLTIVVFQLFNLSIGGYILITLVAILIGFLAYNQNKYNHKIRAK